MLTLAGTIFMTISLPQCSFIRRTISAGLRQQAMRLAAIVRSSCPYNLIHGDSCNGVNFARSIPARPGGGYNNVIYKVGVADPKDDGGAFSCILRGGDHEHGVPVPAQWKFSTTAFDCARIISQC